MRRLLLALAILLVLLVGAAGELLTHPIRRTLGPPPADLPQAESVLITIPDGPTVSGWFVPGRPGMGAVLLLHGVRSDRSQMLGRARFLSRLGHAALLIDLPAHGESGGDHITFGLRESRGVTAALAYLAQRLPAEKIGVIGVSLGAASTVMSQASPPPAAIVLESMYPTLADAVAHRLDLHLGAGGHWLAPLLLWQLPLRLGFSADDLRPIDKLASLHAPLLIASGARDQHTPRAETERLFQAAVEPKELWIVDGAAHVDLHAFGPAAYEARIEPFLARHLRQAPPP